MNAWLFYIVVLLTNIIQGITGFAGTILAMPFGIMLVGFDTAKPILNVLGILAGIYVAVFNFRKIRWKEFLIIIAFMIPSMICGILIRNSLSNNVSIMYKILGTFVILLASIRLIKLFTKNSGGTLPEGIQNVKNVFYLTGAGIIHGMFVSGGPLLIGYLSGKIKEKNEFRATISTVWILLNSLILFSDIKSGYWNKELVKMQLITIPFLTGGMFIGGKLCKVMSQKVFLVLTYILLIISGVSLLLK